MGFNCVPKEAKILTSFKEITVIMNTIIYIRLFQMKWKEKASRTISCSRALPKEAGRDDEFLLCESEQRPSSFLRCAYFLNYIIQKEFHSICFIGDNSLVLWSYYKSQLHKHNRCETIRHTCKIRMTLLVQTFSLFFVCQFHMLIFVTTSFITLVFFHC